MGLASLPWLALSLSVHLAIAAPLRSESAARIVVIDDCTLLDSNRGELIAHQTIEIHDDRIRDVRAYDPDRSLPSGAERISGVGQFAIPGLIDAHVHLVHVLDLAHLTGDAVLPLYLAAGVTSVRSTGDEIVAASLVARFAARHPDTSPRVFTCSPLLDGSPLIHPNAGLSITDVSQVADRIDALLPWNPTTLKIYARTGPEIGRAIIQEGHRRNLFVTAHLGSYTAQQAVVDGIDGLEHIWSVFNYVIPAEQAQQPGHRGRVDFSHPMCQSLVADLARQKILVNPTLAVFRNMILLPDVPEVRDHPDNQFAPRRLRNFWPTYTRTPGAPLEDRRLEFAKYQELTGVLYRAGVPLLAGTDAPEPNVPPGFSLHQELEMLVESGLSPAAALKAATVNNALALRQSEHLGEIAPGRLADIVLLKKNPLEDIRHTRTITLVIRGGIPGSPEVVLKQAAP